MKLIPLLLILCTVKACGQAPPKPSSYNSFMVVGNSSLVHPAATRRPDGRWNVYNDTIALESMYKEVLRLNKELDSLRNNQCCTVQIERWKPGTQHLLIFDGRDTFRFSHSENILIKNTQIKMKKEIVSIAACLIICASIPFLSFRKAPVPRVSHVDTFIDTPKYQYFIRLDVPAQSLTYCYRIIDSIMSDYGEERGGTQIKKAREMHAAYLNYVFSNMRVDSVLAKDTIVVVKSKKK